MLLSEGSTVAARARTVRMLAQEAAKCAYIREEERSATGVAFWKQVGVLGVYVVELFGGICAGLEAVLRTGVRVTGHAYCDTCPVARKVAAQRVVDFGGLYDNFDVNSVAACMSFPADVKEWTDEVVAQVWMEAEHLSPGTPILVVAGWPCQDLSRAGTGRGLAGARSGLFTELTRVLADFASTSREHQLGYIVENVDPRSNLRHDRVNGHDADVITAALGEATCVDAAQFGSYAHRYRAFWSNLVLPAHWAKVLFHYRRLPHRCVDDILEPGRKAPRVQVTDRAPHYVCNKIGERMCALPTLMSYPRSYNFRGNKPRV